MATTAERTIDVLNPATGQTIASVPNMSADEVDEVVERAKKALPEWLDATPKERSELLLKLADVIDDNAEELAQIESRNVGKPLMASRDEMPFSADNLRFFAGAARNLEGKSAGEYIKGYTSLVRREPIGIVAGICPWNYPLMMAVWKMGPALAAGNVQILKPSEQTPMSLLRFVELAEPDRHVAADDSNWAVFETRMNELMPLALRMIEEGFALYDPMPFGLSTDEFMQYAADKGMRRFGTISSARGRPLGEIDLDYSPVQLEDAFADEDEKALAAV